MRQHTRGLETRADVKRANENRPGRRAARAGLLGGESMVAAMIGNNIVSCPNWPRAPRYHRDWRGAMFFGAAFLLRVDEVREIFDLVRRQTVSRIR